MPKVIILIRVLLEIFMELILKVYHIW